ncbi:nitroreductase [Pseudorhizobium tarimense]|uniref:Nitroreductase n=1 Tax=Pseudorhizobium tarimense TaxID=1079109 RepID=A0ABV2H8B3_9HYPH|nr:nitroreductase family protein [Pseudorhizobium tarimense]MCJ8519813.1 nitroreductase family protein [Pseudorhizobium tarimense]
MTDSNNRHSKHPIDAFFLDRWSPRAFTGEAIVKETLLTILDAGHWAPSSGNNQPWRFIYALRDTEHWPVLLDILSPGNRRWASNAAALIIFASRTYRLSKDGEKKPAYTHSFDTGSSWFSIAAQAMKLGYHAHGMEGMDREKAVEVLRIPDGFRVEAACAIGKMAPKETLPDDLRAREIQSQRKPLAEVAFEGRFAGEE